MYFSNRACIVTVANRIDPDRLGDILQGLKSQIIENNIDLAADLPVRIVGDTYATGLCYAFKACCYVDAIAEDVIVVDDDIADVNANAKLDPDILGHIGVLFGHATLEFDRTARSIDRTGELDQHAVTGRLDYATAMRRDLEIDDGFPESLQPSQCAFFITAHEAAIACHIRSQHSRQTPFDALGSQRVPPDR
jgi:hypothetical protein